jgi:hypothetical protein
VRLGTSSRSRGLKNLGGVNQLALLQTHPERIERSATILERIEEVVRKLSLNWPPTVYGFKTSPLFILTLAGRHAMVRNLLV